LAAPTVYEDVLLRIASLNGQPPSAVGAAKTWLGLQGRLGKSKATNLGTTSTIRAKKAYPM